MTKSLSLEMRRSFTSLSASMHESYPEVIVISITGDTLRIFDCGGNEVSSIACGMHLRAKNLLSADVLRWLAQVLRGIFQFPELSWLPVMLSHSGPSYMVQKLAQQCITSQGEDLNVPYVINVLWLFPQNSKTLVLTSSGELCCIRPMSCKW